MHGSISAYFIHYHSFVVMCWFDEIWAYFWYQFNFVCVIFGEESPLETQRCDACRVIFSLSSAIWEYLQWMCDNFLWRCISTAYMERFYSYLRGLFLVPYDHDIPRIEKKAFLTSSQRLRDFFDLEFIVIHSRIQFLMTLYRLMNRSSNESWCINKINSHFIISDSTFRISTVPVVLTPTTFLH